MRRENRVRRALLRGETVVGTMVQELRTPCLAQVLAAAGFDFFMMDMEHGAFSLETVADLAQVGRLAGIVPLVRVPDHGYPWLARPLDAGVMGLMVPRIESRVQVEAVVQAIRYPPAGRRGCGGLTRQVEFGPVSVQEWLGWANEETLLIVQIEERAALEDIDGILSVPGVDVALVGPNDLSISLGVPGEHGHPIMRAAMERVVEAAARHGVASGLHVRDLEVLTSWRARGMRFLMYSSDVGMLRQAGEEGVRALRA